MSDGDVNGELPGLLAARLQAELIAFRRDLHKHPELGHSEFYATAAVAARLQKAGLAPRVLPAGTGLICDIGDTEQEPGAPAVPLLAIRADLDALPIPDTKMVSYRSTVPGSAHACGHDLHTTVVLGTGLVLAGLARQNQLPRPVRLIFQPAEEVTPSGALEMIEAGALERVEQIIALHCDPAVETGRLGLRQGPLTSACDQLTVLLDGPGGHTARPHLTTDLVTAAAHVALDTPAILARRTDTRTGLTLTWGRLETGHACNVIPQHAELSGTVRCLNPDPCQDTSTLVRTVISDVATLYGAVSHVTYRRGAPPVVNDPGTTELLRHAMTTRHGPGAVEDTQQSLGSEDFSWYLQHVPGAMARLGVRPPDSTTSHDLHRSDFDADEAAIRTGVELLTTAAILAPGHRNRKDKAT
ncbi:amidohydrolase [Streptomyces sp. NPDC001667]